MTEKKLIVHFGSGINFPALRKQVPKDEFHVGIDPDYIKPRGNLRTYHGRVTRGRGFELLGGDARKTSLKSGIAHEVRIFDVLNSPEIDNEAQKELLIEAARILKSGRSIFIGHSITPELCTLYQLKTLAREVGLTSKILIKDGKAMQDFTPGEKSVVAHAKADPFFYTSKAGYLLVKLTKR